MCAIQLIGTCGGPDKLVVECHLLADSNAESVPLLTSTEEEIKEAAAVVRENRPRRARRVPKGEQLRTVHVLRKEIEDHDRSVLRTNRNRPLGRIELHLSLST